MNGLYRAFERKRRLPSIQLIADAKRLISESLGEIAMTLIVELMTFNDPFMMIDSVLNSFESQKQHLQLLSLYHTARTSTIRESKLRNG